MKHLWKSRSGRLSFQVLHEFYATVTTKLKPGMDIQKAREEVESLSAWCPIQINSDIIKGVWFIQDRYKLSWWDSLIVPAAQVGDCKYLLTEDLQNDQKLGEVRVINPFKYSPATLGLVSV